jgi:TrpR-related protein YerC/YecD
MNKDIRNISKERMHELWRAIAMLETPEECESFFVDLCTVAELDEMAKRLEVAKCIDAGMSYGDAAEKTGASTATISRVKRSLYYGNGGYRTALDRLSGKEDKGDE